MILFVSKTTKVTERIMNKMKLKKFVFNEYDTFKNDIPHKHHLPYIREELNGYYSILTENGDNNYTMLNSTSKHMLDLCDGKNTVSDILEKLLNFYPNVDEKTIKNDMIETLFSLTKLKAIDWKGENKIMINPMLNNIEIQITENTTLSLANEGEIRDIQEYLVNFFENYNKKCNENKLNYYWGDDSREFLDLTIIRQCIFTYYKDFFIIKQNGRINGIVIMKPSIETYLHNVQFNLISIDQDVFDNVVKAIIEFYQRYPAKHINLIQFDYIKESIENSDCIEEKLLNLNFEHSGTIKELYGRNLDVLNYCYYMEN